MRRTVAVLALGAAVAGCGSANVVSPVDVAQKYAYAIGTGNDASACTLLDPQARDAMVASTGAHATCAGLMGRCLPARSTVTSADKLQLLYVNVDLRTRGSHAVAVLSGLPVARAIGRVTMVQHRGRWRLTTPGRGISRCVRRLRRGRRAPHRPTSIHG